MTERLDVVRTTPRFSGRVFNVRSDDVRYEDGPVHTLDVVEHRGSFAIIATAPADRLVLVRQYRHPAGRCLWEIPAGTAEPGEDPRDGALRELAEESGYRAAQIRDLGALYVTPGFCTEVLHFFHAWDLTPGEQNTDDDERIEVATVTLAEAKRLLASGEIADVKTALSVAWLEGPRTEISGMPGR